MEDKIVKLYSQTSSQKNISNFSIIYPKENRKTNAALYNDKSLYKINSHTYEFKDNNFEHILVQTVLTVYGLPPPSPNCPKKRP